MKPISYLKYILCLLSTVYFEYGLYAQNDVSQIDNTLSEKYIEGKPGATALVYRKGTVIFRKGFGLANMELNVPMQPENVFEIGSITKQFTAIAILMLEEQGKLDITDDITKFIPDYPTHGKSISIHHLLNHTSGIKSYTSMPSFMEKARVDMSPKELIDVFKNEPMDFDPGEQFLYNNSGYILLGHIIEVVTEDTYENFIQKNVFDPLGMENSYYGSHKRIIANRAYGYQKNGDTFVNADYLSMTLPYAAGSLMSNVDDLLKWQLALNKYQLVSKESYEKAIHGSTLNNGEKIGYGYGLQDGITQGSKSISHGGGIFGYTTMGVYLPEEDIFVSVLSNCNCNSPSDVAVKVAAIAMGKPFPTVKDAITLSETQMEKWIGSYEFSDGAIRYVTMEQGKLYSQRGDGQKFEIFPLAPDHFIFEDGTISYMFSMIDGKKQATFTSGETFIGSEVNKMPPPEKAAIELPVEVLHQYIGKYELQPSFIIEVTVEDDQIFAQATGQPKIEIFAEKEDLFFLKVVSAQLIFQRAEDNKITSVTLLQGGQEMSGKKLE
ncbi:MAG: serine hydrolase [Bacteroidota bacterium]